MAVWTDGQPALGPGQNSRVGFRVGGRQIPEARKSLVIASRDQPMAIGTDAKVKNDLALSPFQDEGGFGFDSARSHAPKSSGPVETAGDEPAFVRSESYRIDDVLVAAQNDRTGGRIGHGEIPKASSLIITAGCQPMVVWAKGDAGD